MTKKEKLKALEVIKQKEIDLINEINQMIEQTEAEKVSLKTQINELCGDKYYCGVYIQKEQALEIINNFMSGSKLVKMDFEIYEIEKEIEGKIIKEAQDGTE